jgi:DNA-directed RNA polymerase specialized sigma24 family protein
VKLFYCADYSQQEIAQALGVRKDRVAQLLREARERMAA